MYKSAKSTTLSGRSRFLKYDLGYFDRDQDRVEPGPNPFAPDTVLTMCPE